MMVEAGFDFLVIDMEHGSISDGKLSEILDVFNNSNCLPFVRVAKNENILIRRALDLGAKGIIVPGVNSKDDVEKARKAIFYPPNGERGIGFSKANKYGLNFDKYFNEINKEIKFIAQIEHINAIKNIDEIFSNSYIDYYMIGPYDLSGSMGIVGDFKHSEYKKILIE